MVETAGPTTLRGKRILLVISGGIAAYKALELIRLLRQAGASVRAILTEAAARFVTPLSVSALTEDKAYSDLWSLTDESEMGHIRLSREADLVVVAPATADLLAKLAHGLADDLASTALLAADKPVLVAPAMNVRMWEHPATIANLAVLASRGVHRIGPDTGAMACGEFGMGRMAEPPEILRAVARLAGSEPSPLSGRSALVTSGPTFEAIDPVRFIGNRSSGKQGHAIAAALAAAGARTVLVSGPTAEADPPDVTVVKVESALQMLAACQAALPVDIAVCAAAVSDWRPETPAQQKLKKRGDGHPPTIALTENPDILASLSRAGPTRPALVIGFALETENLIASARAKLAAKGCDWILANQSTPDAALFGEDQNLVTLLTGEQSEAWPKMDKRAVASRLAEAIAAHLAGGVERNLSEAR